MCKLFFAIVTTMDRLTINALELHIKHFTDEDLQKIARTVRTELRSRKPPLKEDEMSNILRKHYRDFAGEVNEDQIRILRKLVKMIEDHGFTEEMSESGKRWHQTVDTFFGDILTSDVLDNDQARLGRVVEAIDKNHNRNESGSVRHGLLMVFLHAAVHTIRAANRNQHAATKSFSTQALQRAISGESNNISTDLAKALRAGGRFARLFERNLGYLFSLKAGTKYM